MLNIYLCEDNPKQLQILKDYVEKCILIEDYDLYLRCATRNPKELLESIPSMNGTGLYFLDIDLNASINGLSLAQKIRKLDPRGFIVFVTTHSEMAYMTFTYKVEAMDFIIKDDFSKLQQKMHQCIIDAYLRYSSPNNLEQKTFTITSSGKEYCVPLEDIIYFETSENIHKVLLHSENRIIEFHAKLKDIELSLDDRFYRCHRSFIINRHKIKEIDLKEHIIIMKNDAVCFASSKLIKNLIR